jgi:SAM-dependent methyltransferase
VSAGFADHFSAVADAYAAARPTYPPSLFDHLAAQAPSRAQAWDCAAGNGQATLPLAERFERVTATDASAAQLSKAPAHPRISYRVSSAQESGLPGRSVDLVTVAQALHWLDLAPFYQEVSRVLAPGGVLAVWCYGLQRLDDPEIDRLLEHFYADVVGPYWAPARALVETGYRTVPFPFEELPAPSFEMTHDWRLADLLAYIRTWSATAAYTAARGRDPVVPLGEALASHWGSAERRAVRWPLSLRLGRSGRAA